MMYICNCEVCGEPIPRRPHQRATVRACKPKCACELMRREHPDLELVPGTGARMVNGLKPGPRKLTAGGPS